MNLTELSKTIRFDNASKGFDPLEGGIDRYLLLAISEICEAQEELRDGREITEIYYDEFKSNRLPTIEELEKTLDGKENGYYIKKPCGFPVEIADAIIRLLDISAKLDIECPIPDFTSWRWTEPIDYYLIEVVKNIGEAHNGYFVGFKTYKFIHSIQTATSILIHLCLYYQIDILQVIDEKLKFNRSRPPKHGRKF
jgi:hypothetical protein